MIIITTVIIGGPQWVVVGKLVSITKLSSETKIWKWLSWFCSVFEFSQVCPCELLVT